MDKRQIVLIVLGNVAVVGICCFTFLFLARDIIATKQAEVDRVRAHLEESQKDLQSVRAESDSKSRELSLARDRIDVLQRETEDFRARIFAIQSQIELRNSNPLRVTKSLPSTSTFIPCRLELCGNYPQNVAAFSAVEAVAAVGVDGDVRITMQGVKELKTGALAKGKTFEVFIGRFGPEFWGSSVGSISLDEGGSYSGPVQTPHGPLVLRPEQLGQQFVLNTPGVRSEFISTP